MDKLAQELKGLSSEVTSFRETVVEHSESKEELAMWFISNYSYVDGANHKQWLIDQLTRILMGTPVIKEKAEWAGGHFEFRYSTGKPSNEYLKWVGDDIDSTDVVGINP
jgi:hypothetical protein